jgi:hypothetical protein
MPIGMRLKLPLYLMRFANTWPIPPTSLHQLRNSYVIEEQVDGGQGDRGRWELVVGRSEADGHLPRQVLWELSPQQHFQGTVKIVNHASLSSLSFSCKQ